ncbi:MAG: acylphosphatase [Rickettsiales bacterium]|nr:acylphosphatase [Rickettsiales bacterium]
MPQEVIALHVIIHGRVQGVGYRAWAAGNAKKVGLVGWVRNRMDGTVEALFQGTQEQLDEMLKRCASGPLPAKVLQIEQTEVDADLSMDGFERRDTA